jgi:hypothetical protein
MLNDEQIQMLRIAIQSSGWTQVMKPLLANRANAAIKALVLPPSERRGDYEGISDDGLRGRIQEMEWMLFAWDNEIVVHEQNRRRDELQRQQNGPDMMSDPHQTPANP